MVEIESVRTDANGVILDVCLDTSQGDLIDDATGNSIKAQLPVGQRSEADRRRIRLRVPLRLAAS